MIQDHAYPVPGGLNRAGIGHSIGLIAAEHASLIATAFLALLGIVKSLGVVTEAPSIILWPLGTGAVCGGRYWLFNKHVWKWKWVAGLLCNRESER